MLDVVLVDGTGRPKIVSLADDTPPLFVGYAHEGFASGPFRAVRFDRCLGVEIDGRAVYRQVNCGQPDIKFAYLPSVTEPFNPPKAR